ncbi:MAG TPA: DUF1579 domain-containing protein [Blastocatellia bacterium]|nr:DUF1579 domain-containing protein [Blastocatellia bacterium]
MRIRTKRLATTFAGLIVVGVLAHTVASQEQKAEKASSSTPPGVTAAAPAGAPDAKAMEEMMKMNQPGEQHALLKKMVGKFDADVTVKMAPDAPEMKSKGAEVNEMILNDRFLKSDFSGDMMSMPFKGINLSGYDNMKKKYVSAWVDSMGTGIMTSEGTADSSGKKITYRGEAPCMAEGGKIKAFRQVLTINDDNSHDFEMFEAGPDGKEFRGLYIKYTRAK